MVTKHIAPYTLSEDECQVLFSIIDEYLGSAVTFDSFSDAMLGFFEDISGFETMPPATRRNLLTQLWSLYMAKKAAAVESTTSTEAVENKTEATAPDAKPSKSSKGTEPVVIDLNTPTIRAAIDQGKALVAEGKTKADAARSIFNEIKDESKEVIIAAFIEGATLTAKGALTYWYNCRRKAAKGAARTKDGASETSLGE